MTFCDAPFAANPTSFASYPPNLIRSALTFNPSPLNTHIGIAIMLKLHLLMAGVGTFFFVRQWELSSEATLMAAFIFIFSAGFVRRSFAIVCWITATAWLPIVLLLLHAGFASESLRRKFAFASGVGLVFGISLLAGAPHTSLFMAVTIAGYGILYRLTSLRRTDFQKPKALALRVGSDAMAGVLIAILSAMVAAMLLVPAAQLSGLSDRGNQINSLREMSHQISWLVSILVTYSGDEKQWHDYRLAGLGALLVALAAFLHHRRRDVLIFGLLFLMFIDISLGPPQPSAKLFIWMAPYRLNHASCAMWWSRFPLALLVGFGVDAVSARWQRRRARPLFAVLFSVAGTLLLVVLWFNIVDHQYLPEATISVIVLPAIILGVLVAKRSNRPQRIFVGMRQSVPFQWHSKRLTERGRVA